MASVRDHIRVMNLFLHRHLRAALVAVPVILAAGFAAAQERPGFIDDLFGRGEQQAPVSKAQMNDSDLVVRLERLENQLRQMTGAMEQLQYRNQQLEQQVRRLQDENQQLAARAGTAPSRPMTAAAPPVSAPPVATGPSPVSTPVTPGRRGDVFDPSQNPNAPGAPRALGGGGGPVIATPEPVTEPPPVGAPGGRQAGAPLDLSTVSTTTPPADAQLPPPPGRNPNATGMAAVAPPTNTPKDEYDLGYGYVLRKEYAQAEDTFRSFLRKYPGDRLAPEAQYWLGESMFQRQRYQDAADSFLVVVRNHENSGKAPDSLLRLGQSLAAIGQKEMACASLAEVGRKYPRASASVKRGVEQEQKRVRC